MSVVVVVVDVSSFCFVCSICPVARPVTATDENGRVALHTLHATTAATSTSRTTVRAPQLRNSRSTIAVHVDADDAPADASIPSDAAAIPSWNRLATATERTRENEDIPVAWSGVTVCFVDCLKLTADTALRATVLLTCPCTIFL
jgi:transcription elongation factor